mmetsp:Transcript_26165/g.52819  ORF Transcript_26165/g.52819 Transcript_26165/m.52819 type:complete len:581 (+) Transcript_26165:90-1832(+)
MKLSPALLHVGALLVASTAVGTVAAVPHQRKQRQQHQERQRRQKLEDDGANHPHERPRRGMSRPPSLIPRANHNNNSNSSNNNNVRNHNNNRPFPNGRPDKTATKTNFKSPRIVGGNEATPGRYPYMVSLQLLPSSTNSTNSTSPPHSCGGTIIAPDVILTAAHCLGGFHNVIVGRHNLTVTSQQGQGQGQVISVDDFDSILMHPRYDATKITYDVGLVILSKEIDLTDAKKARMIKLNREPDVPSPLQPVTAAGWGFTSSLYGSSGFWGFFPVEEPVTSEVLMESEMYAATNEFCYETVKSIWDDLNSFNYGYGYGYGFGYGYDYGFGDDFGGFDFGYTNDDALASENSTMEEDDGSASNNDDFWSIIFGAITGDNNITSGNSSTTVWNTTLNETSDNVDDMFSYTDDFWSNYNYNNNNYNYDYSSYEPPEFPLTYEDFDSILCTTDPSSQICLGDSGGPLLLIGDDDDGADDVQVGIVSWLLGDCNKGEPGMYARVSTVYDWIERSVCRHSGNVPEWFDCQGVKSLSGSGSGGSSSSSSGSGSSTTSGKATKVFKYAAKTGKRIFRNPKIADELGSMR